MSFLPGEKVSGIPGTNASPSDAAPKSRRSACEIPAEALPAGIVVLLQRRRLQGEGGRAADEARLEHESEHVVELMRLELGTARRLEDRDIGAVRRHAIMQAGATRQEARGLAVIDAVDEAHELVHDVAVEPGRPE